MVSAIWGIYPLDKSSNDFTFLSEWILACQGLVGRFGHERKLIFLSLQNLFLSGSLFDFHNG